MSSNGSATYVPSAIIVVLNHNDQIAVYENSNLTITVTTPHTLQSPFLSSLTQLSIILPSSFTTTTNSSCSPSCVITNRSITISSIGLKLRSFVVSLGNIVLPLLNPSS